MMGRLFGYFSKYKLRLQLIVINAVIAIVPVILIGAISYFVNVSSVEKNISNSVDIFFNQVNSRLDEYFNNINFISKSIFLNPTIQKVYAITETEDSINQFRTFEEGINDRPFQHSYLVEDSIWWNLRKYDFIRGFLDPFTEVNDSIRGISILFSSDNRNYQEYNSYKYVNQYILEYVKKLDMDEISSIGSGRPVIRGPFINNERLTGEFIAVRVIKSVLGTYKNIGFGVIVLNRNVLDGIVSDKNISMSSEIYIIDSSGRIIGAADMKKCGKLLNGGNFDQLQSGKYVKVDGQSYMVKTSFIKGTEWKMVALTNISQFYSESRLIKYTISAILLVVFVIVILINLLFNIRVTMPIKMLSDACDRVAGGDFRFSIKFNKKNEITAIADDFNNMVIKVKSLTNQILSTQQRLYEIELEKKQFEINALQSQINSHFLYNTLHCIRGMAISNKGRTAGVMIDHLVDFFRYNTCMGEYVTIRTELKYLEAYLEIQRIRFPGKFKVIFDVDERLMEFQILKMILQPVVENTILHGFEQKNGKGIIKVVFCSENGGFVIKVLDNGLGMDEEKLMKLSEDFNAEESLIDWKNDKQSIGIINIYRRLRIHYSEKFTFRIKSWKNIGTVVTLKINV